MSDPSGGEVRLVIRPISLPGDLDTAIRFTIDTYTCTFGSADRFHDTDGKGVERFIARITRKCADRPGSCVHLWDGEVIVGQAVMGAWKKDPSLGYVDTYYLLPGYRGRGLGKQIDEYVVDYLRSQDFAEARLSVATTNQRALRFYTRQGWVNLGQKEDDPVLFLMGRTLRPAGAG